MISKARQSWTVYGADRNEKNITFGNKQRVVQVDMKKAVGNQADDERDTDLVQKERCLHEKETREEILVASSRAHERAIGRIKFSMLLPISSLRPHRGTTWQSLSKT